MLLCYYGGVRDVFVFSGLKEGVKDYYLVIFEFQSDCPSEGKKDV